ncbi:MAG: transposase [Polyangiaceae bacterium]|nr:transposase [Polyangiaceae bacterium]
MDWNYHSGLRARQLLDHWTNMARRSKLEPFKTFARTLRQHRRELLAWFAARGLFAHGATEGFNNKAGR